MRLGRERGVQSEEIRQRQELVDFLDQLDLERTRAGRGKIRIVSQDAHPERDRAPAQLRADPAHADDAERFVVELGPFKLFPVPLPGLQVGMGLRDFARDRNEERESVLRGRDGVAARRVHHDHAAPGGGFDIHVIHPDAGATDHLQLRPRLQNGRGHFRLAADHEGAEVGNQFHQLRFALPGADDDFERAVRAQLLHATRRNGIGD